MYEWFLNDDVTPVDDEAIGNFQAGADSDVLELHLWKDQGNPAGQDGTDLAIAMRTENPGNAGEGVSTGVAPQDEMWPRVRFVGHDNTADPTQEPFTTDWIHLGAFRVLPFPSLHAGCARYLEVKFHPPGTAGEDFWRFFLVLLESEHSVALQLPVSRAGTGIETGVGDRARSHLVRGGEVSVSAPADQFVRVGARQICWQGQLRGEIAADVELDQTDGAAEALAAAESYWAVLSQGAGSAPTVTKGLRAADPVKPSLPAGEIFLRWVRVDYQAGGVSEIEADDLDGETVYGRHRVVAGVGREIRVHPGFALGPATWRYWTRVDPVNLDPDDTHYLWQGPDGRWDTTTNETPPSDGHLGPWAEIDTDATDVTAIRDRRRYAGRSRALTLRGAPPAGPGVIQQLTVTDDQLWLERVVLRASDAGGGSAGQTVVDVERTRDGVTVSLYPGSATDDQRPVIAFDAGVLIHDSGIPEVSDLRYGDVVTFRTVEHPTGGVPSELELQLVCRKE